jgi:hypothetical protein
VAGLPGARCPEIKESARAATAATADAPAVTESAPRSVYRRPISWPKGKAMPNSRWDVGTSESGASSTCGPVDSAVSK